MVGKKWKMLYGDFEGGFELTNYERGQNIQSCKSVYDILKEQYDIRYERLNKLVKLCEKLSLYSSKNKSIS